MKKNPNKIQSPEEKRYARLGWMLLEWQLMYYHPDKIAEKYHDVLTVDDDVYDRYEREYLSLCKQHGFVNSVVWKSYPGFEGVALVSPEPDLNRPAVRLVLSKYGVRR